MAKLEEQIRASIESEMKTNDDGLMCLFKGGESEEVARAATEVAKKYIEQAVVEYHTNAQAFLQEHGFLNNTALDLIHTRTKDWLKENGVI